MQEETTIQKHRVGVVVSEPDHPAVSMRKATKQKFVKLNAGSKEEAVNKAKAFYKKQGYKVHSAEHHSTIEEELKDGQHKIDANKNGKLDAHDFKLLRKMKKEEVELDEAIKGWKHAHTDIAKGRAAASSANKEVHLHQLTKAGKESGMHDARRAFSSIEDAEKHHENVHKLNPGKTYKHNLYVDGKLVKTLGESFNAISFSQFIANLDEAKKRMCENDDEEDDVEEKQKEECDDDLDEGLKPGQGSKPGWMLKADPALAAKPKVKIHDGDDDGAMKVSEEKTKHTFQDLLNRIAR